MWPGIKVVFLKADIHILPVSPITSQSVQYQSITQLDRDALAPQHRNHSPPLPPPLLRRTSRQRALPKLHQHQNLFPRAAHARVPHPAETSLSDIFPVSTGSHRVDCSHTATAWAGVVCGVYRRCGAAGGGCCDGRVELLGFWATDD